MRTQMEKNVLLMADSLIIEEHIYFFARNYNALFVLDFVNKDPIFLGSIPDENIFGECLISSMEYWKDRLLFIPCRMNANKIWTFNLKEKKWTSISVDFDDIKFPFEKVAYSVICENVLYLVGCRYNGIIKVYLDSERIEYFPNIIDPEDDLHSLFSCELVDRSLFIPSPNRNKVSVVDLDSMDVDVYEVGNDECVYSGICKYGDVFWLSPRGTCPYVVVWNGCKEYKMYMLPEDIILNGEYVFAGEGCIGTDIYMCGGYRRKSLKICKGDYDKKCIIPYSFVLYKNVGNNGYIMQDYDGNVSIKWEGNDYNFNLFWRGKTIFESRLVETFGDNVIYENNSVRLDTFIDLMNVEMR